MQYMGALDITSILDTGVVAARVQSITGNAEAAATAAGWSAWIASVTGKPPAVQELPEKRAGLVLDEGQVAAMRKWLNSQVGGLLAAPKKEVLDVNLGSALGPWAMQYAVPAMLGAFVLGWLGHYLLSGRSR